MYLNPSNSSLTQPVWLDILLLYVYLRIAYSVAFGDRQKNITI